MPELRHAPRVIAHRGMSSLAPENTLAAFRLCADHGVRWFEFDCDVLADGTVVVIHDATLDRTTDHKGEVHALTLADLDDVDAGSWFDPRFAGEPVPTLRQVVDLMNEAGLDANLELKHTRGVPGGPLLAGVARELERLHPDRQLLVSSFDPLLLAGFRRLAPHWPLACLYEHHRFTGIWRSVASLLGAVAIHPGDLGLEAGHVRQFTDAGLAVNVWTVNSVDRAAELFGWGVGAVFTDVAQDFPPEWREARQLPLP